MHMTWEPRVSHVRTVVLKLPWLSIDRDTNSDSRALALGEGPSTPSHHAMPRCQVKCDTRFLPPMHIGPHLLLLTIQHKVDAIRVQQLLGCEPVAVGLVVMSGVGRVPGEKEEDA